MLNTFIQLLQNNALHLNKELRRVPATSCTNSTIDVLDFDLIKDTFYSNLGLQQNDKLKSVDALKIIPAKNRILLIEMKKYDTTLQQSIKEFMEERIKSLRCKIVDSIFIILGIAGHYHIIPDFYKYFFNNKQLNIKAVFLSNISNKEFVTANIANLPEFNISIVTRRVDSNIAFFNCELFYNALQNNAV